MEIEFDYVRRITGKLAANSKEDTTKKVREKARFNLAEYSDEEAPVAYRRYFDFYGEDERQVTIETRWLNGSHWYVSESVPPVDDSDMIVEYDDYRLLYDRLEPDEAIYLESPHHGYVKGNKKWFKVTSDDRDAAYEAAAKHFTENTAVIGGKLAIRILEPSIGLSFSRLSENGPLTIRRDLEDLVAVDHKRWPQRYGMSLLEYESATDAVVATAETSGLVGSIVPSKYPLPRFEILIPDAFSASLAEEATEKVLADGLLLGERNIEDLPFRSKVAFRVLKDSISENGQIKGDTLEALDKFRVFRGSINEHEFKEHEGSTKLLMYLDVDLMVAGTRLEAHRALTDHFDPGNPTPSSPPSPFVR